MKSILARDAVTAMFNFLWTTAPTRLEQEEVTNVYQSAQREHGRDYEKIATCLLQYAEDDRDWWLEPNVKIT